MKVRFWFVTIFLFAFAAAITARLFQVQVTERERFEGDPTRQAEVVKAKYGRVFDRNGVVLWDKLYVEGKEIVVNPYKHLKGMSAILGSVVNNRNIIPKMRGQDGIISSTKNKKNGKIIKENKKDPLINGEDVYLTLDLRIQEIVENAVKEFVPAFEADGASVTVMDPRTGQTLAIVNFNPKTKRYDALLQSFEPGSIFKPITAVIALENGIDPNKNIDININNGKAQWLVSKAVGEKPIKDSHLPEKCRVSNLGKCEMNMQEAMIESSNIAFGKYVVEEVGYEKFFEGVSNFSIGQENSSVPLAIWQSEPKKVRDDRTRAAQGFGQSIELTSLDMVKAFSAIANGGMLYAPKLILENGIDSADTEKRMIRKVLTSTENTRLLREMLRGVLKEGTAKNVRTQYDFFDFAGKTGTAQFLDSAGNYTKDINNSSFIGIDNAADPHFVCLVTMFNTKKAGATAAGPVFKNIMEKIYLHPALSPKNFALEYAPADSICNDVSFLGYSKKAAEDMALQERCLVRFDGNSGAVVAQKIVRDSSETYLKLIMRENQKYTGKMPDVRGLDLVSALGMLEHAKSVRYEGSGRVAKQYPEVGEIVKNGFVILTLRD